MTELEQYRAEIDAVDDELIRLFQARRKLTGLVGAYKARNHLPVLDANREKAVLSAKIALVDDPSAKVDIASLYQTILGISRRQQRRLVRGEGAACGANSAAQAPVRPPVTHPRVVYQGEPGAYSELAAMGFFGETVDSRGLPWFEDAFLALQRGEADYAVLPIENSSTGSIRQVYDLLAQYEYAIVGEWQVKVEHCLLALEGVNLEDVQIVYSHEQGLMQSEHFLDQHRGWKRVATLDTAGSAMQLAQSGDRTAAAICSKRAAELYGLHVLLEGVNDNRQNYTRFVVVSAVPEARPEKNKISALFTLPHQSGSLHEILTLFSVKNLNLVKLESRPIPGKSWEYLFFMEFTGTLSDPGMDGVLQELSQFATEIRILGNFKAYESPEKACSTTSEAPGWGDGQI